MMLSRRFTFHALLLVSLILFRGNARAATDPEVLVPVPAVQDGRLEVRTAQGEGELPIHTSRDWTVPQPDVERAIVVIHGWPRRDLHSAEHAATRPGIAAQNTIIITPQFLIEADVAAHHLPDTVLRWGVNGWDTGYDAKGPAPISSFDALDAILARLADRRLFPKLSIVVIAGHSAGGRFVQHYAAIGHGQPPLEQNGVHIRYVVANPSVYLYFTPARPVSLPGTCARLDRWEYGVSGGVPRYAEQPVEPSLLRQNYLARDIIYLLGEADNDPNHHQLDRTCAGEAQGATRFERGVNYVNVAVQPGVLAANQRMLTVPGVGHSSWKMYSSECGLAALFDQGLCAETFPRNASTKLESPGR
jgi:pimeloyl-ACP methyl ester carboxylesterase